MNVLISSAAAKIQLIEHFQEAVLPLGGRVVAADMDPDCCARYFADAFVPMPADDDPGYAEALFSACKTYDIGLIVPTRDGELWGLSALRSDLAALGVTLPLPAEDRLGLCQDKLAFHAFCEAEGFPVLPRAYPEKGDDACFPLFARAREGAGSRAAFIIGNREEYERLSLQPDAYLFQPCVTAPEYSCDVFSDFGGKALQAVVRERQKLVCGESWRSEIVDMPEAASLAMRLCEALGLVGHNLVQLFWDQEDGPRLIEVNPRFGGCSALSITGGLQSPRRMIQLLTGREDEALAPHHIAIGMTSIRYTRDIFIEKVGEP